MAPSHDPEEKFSKNGDLDISKGPIQKRSCTDIICLLIFLAHWVFGVYIAVYSFSNGNPAKIIAGQDFMGNFCGVSDKNNKANEKADHPWMMFTYKTDLLDSANGATLQDKYAHLMSTVSVDKLFKSFTMVCVEECPCFGLSCDGEGRQSTPLPRKASISSIGAQMDALSESFCPYDAEYCAPILPLPNKAVLGRYCLPNILSAKSAAKLPFDHTPDATEHKNSNAINPMDLLPSDWTASWGSYIADLTNAWPVYAGAFGVAFVISLLFLVLLRLSAGCLVWGSILASIAGTGFLGWFVFDYAQKYAPNDEAGIAGDKNSKIGYEIIAYVVWVLAGFVLLATMCFCKEIGRSIGVVKTAAMFIYHTASALLIPVFMWIFSMALYAYFIFAFVYLLSADKEMTDAERQAAVNVVGAQGTRLAWDHQTRWYFAYQFFSLLWNNAFLLGLSQLVLAGAVANWYFATVDEKGNRKVEGTRLLCCSPAVTKSVYNAFRYHTGTVAFGSFILAAVQFIKWWLIYITQQTKAIQKNPGEECGTCLPCGIGSCLSKADFANKTLVFALRLLTYVVACFERCVRFLNRHAYIQVAVLGKNFIRSAKAAFFLILRNAAMLLFSGVLTWCLRMVGLLVVVACTGLIAFLILDGPLEKDVNTPWLPVGVTCLIAWLVGSLVLEVFTVAVDCTVQCFFADVEMNNGTGQYTPEPLKKFIKVDPDAMLAAGLSPNGKKLKTEEMPQQQPAAIMPPQFAVQNGAPVPVNPMNVNY